MLYQLADTFILNDIECKVSFIDTRGYAYLTPVYDCTNNNGDKLFAGLVFAVADRKGRDLKTGEKIHSTPRYKQSQAV